MASVERSQWSVCVCVAVVEKFKVKVATLQCYHEVPFQSLFKSMFTFCTVMPRNPALALSQIAPAHVLLLKAVCPLWLSWMCAPAAKIWPHQLRLKKNNNTVKIKYKPCWRVIRRTYNRPNWHYLRYLAFCRLGNFDWVIPTKPESERQCSEFTSAQEQPEHEKDSNWGTGHLCSNSITESRKKTERICTWAESVRDGGFSGKADCALN